MNQENKEKYRKIANSVTVKEIISHLRQKRHSIQDARDIVNELSAEIEKIVNQKIV